MVPHKIILLVFLVILVLMLLKHRDDVGEENALQR